MSGVRVSERVMSTDWSGGVGWYIEIALGREVEFELGLKLEIVERWILFFSFELSGDDRAGDAGCGLWLGGQV